MRKTTTYARRVKSGQAARRGDGITTARMTNTRLTAAEIGRIMAPLKSALDAMRQARAIYPQWVALCTAAHVAMAVEDGGVIRGQREIIQLASDALDRIGERCGRTADGWAPRACLGLELSDLADLVAAHSRQLHELTYGEYVRQFDLAVARVASCGGLVFYAEETAP
jgi:hypothetical protein